VLTILATSEYQARRISVLLYPSVVIHASQHLVTYPLGHIVTMRAIEADEVPTRFEDACAFRESALKIVGVMERVDLYSEVEALVRKLDGVERAPNRQDVLRIITQHLPRDAGNNDTGECLTHFNREYGPHAGAFRDNRGQHAEARTQLDSDPA
jgi:hypothetical protein